jgi:hypothetical protein
MNPTARGDGGMRPRFRQAVPNHAFFRTSPANAIATSRLIACGSASSDLTRASSQGCLK